MVLLVEFKFCEEFFSKSVSSISEDKPLSVFICIFEIFGKVESFLIDS